MPPLTQRSLTSPKWIRRIALLLTVACASSETVQRIAAAHPNAAFEATADGCNWREPHLTHRFGSDLQSAYAWTHQVVGGAAAIPCTAIIVAVEGTTRQEVYRLARDSTGKQQEKVAGSK